MMRRCVRWLFALMVGCGGGLSWSSEPTSTIEELPISDSDRDHWAWRPLIAPSVPLVVTNSAHRSPLDAWIWRDSADAIPVEASREVLARRLSLDLTGMPPEADDLNRFLADGRPDAVERYVSRLLAAPAYGEHAAQRWLELSRFAETDGFEHDKIRPQAWRYRDWVIRALNQDLQYDRFVQQQLAGDQLRSEQEADGTIATMFCLAGPDMPDINRQDERADFVLNDITSTVGAVFLAMQISCAQCHDHKFDPISQADFYRLRAVFAAAVQPKKDRPLERLREEQGSEVKTFVMVRGDFRQPGPEIDPGVPRIADPRDTMRPLFENSASPRVALAKWLTQDDHPLTARVQANRIWQSRFGEGLAATPSDFGFAGIEPAEPELIDYLATELVRHDWSDKWMQRQIVTSQVYRQRPARQRSQGAIPREGYPRRRLTGESLRDSMLAVCGEIDRQAGGASVRPSLPAELTGTLLKGQWQADADLRAEVRKSIYIFARRNLRFPIFEAFDRPDALVSCPQRNEATTAPQSLLMMNSGFSDRMAEALVARVQREAPPDLNGQWNWLYRTVLGRAPDATELAMVQAFFHASDRQEDAWQDLALVLLNSNESLYFE